MDNVNDRLYQLARAQVDMVKSALGKRFTFEDDPNNETESGYTTYGTVKTPTAIIVLRLSNHICSMKNWTERYKQKLIANNKLLKRMGRNLQDPYKDRCFYSVVFKSFDYKPNDIGKWKATCSEYVFNPLEVEENRSIGIIAQDCMKLSTNQSVINGINPTIRTATITETKYTNMNKKQIRLTESDLKQIVKESVNKILSEAYGTMPKDDIKRAANLDAASQSRFDERGEEIEDIKNDDFSRRLQDLQRDLTKCWWMANSLGSHMKHNEFLGKASERYANYVMDNISNASDGLDRIIAIAKMKIGQ